MTQEEIIAMAREAGLERIVGVRAGGQRIVEVPNVDLLERFAALVAEPWIETNKALAKEIIELKKQAEQEPVANKYNHKRIGWELERTAQGESYYGNALYVAIDFPFLNRLEKDCLHRYMHGSETPNDRFVLQDIAMKVYSEPEAAPVRTKDLTEDEISEVVFSIVKDTPTNYERTLCRAVISADREKNNANNNT